MRVLLIHQHFNTPEKGGALRSYYLAKALLDAGHSVQVVTSYNNREASNVQLEGIDVLYLPVRYENHFKFSARIKAYLLFSWKVIRRSRHFRGINCSYTISTPLTTGIAALWLKWRRNIPFFFEVGDLWPEAPIALGVIKNPILKKTLFAFERTVYKNSLGIIALSVTQQELLRTKTTKEVHLIPNMADVDFFQQQHSKSEPSYTLPPTPPGTLIISYAGALGFANGLDYLIECARLCRENLVPVHFFICGEGAEREYLKAKAQPLGNITFLPFQNRMGTRAIIDISDLMFVCYRHVQVLESGSPNKYFDSLAAGKAIAINFSGWMREEIEKAKCGIILDAENPTSCLPLFRDLIQNPNGLHAMKCAARELAEKYSRKKLGEKFVRIIKTVQA